MNKLFAIEFRKAVAEILDQDPLRCNDWPKVYDILNERFADQAALAHEFLETEGERLPRHFTLRGAVHPAYLSKVCAKDTFFLLLDARAIPYPRLQDLLQTLRGDVTWYNVYGEKDVILKCMGAREQIVRFAEEVLKPNLVDSEIIEVKEIHRCWGIDVLPPRPRVRDLKQVDSKRLGSFLRNFNPNSDTEYHKEVLAKNILLGPVVIEDTQYTQRIRALVLIGWFGNWKQREQFPEALRRLDKDYLQITALYSSSDPDNPYLAEIITRDAGVLDTLTDDIAGVLEGVRPRTLVVARTVMDPWPTLESVDISLYNVRLLAEEAATKGLRDIFDELPESTLEAIQKLRPTDALFVIGTLQRLRSLDLSFLLDRRVFKDERELVIRTKFDYAREEIERSAIEQSATPLDAAMNALGAALEGILWLSLRKLFADLFDRKFEARVRARLNLPKGWYEDPTGLSLGKLQWKLKEWSKDPILRELFPISKQLLRQLDFCVEMRNRGSHYGGRTESASLLAAEDALVHAVQISQELYKEVIANHELNRVDQASFVRALAAAAQAGDDQALSMLIENDSLDVKVNAAITELRGQLAGKGLDIDRVIKIVDESSILEKEDVPEEEKQAFKKLVLKWKESGEKALEEVPDRIWATIWKILEHVATSGD